MGGSSSSSSSSSKVSRMCRLRRRSSSISSNSDRPSMCWSYSHSLLYSQQRSAAVTAINASTVRHQCGTCACVRLSCFSAESRHAWFLVPLTCMARRQVRAR
jgi:hypothetical protein